MLSTTLAALRRLAGRRRRGWSPSAADRARRDSGLRRATEPGGDAFRA